MVAILRFFVSHPTAANLFMAALILFGAFSLPSLTRETFPKLPLDTVTVELAYKGASAEDVAQSVCLRVENALDAVEHLDEMRCEARVGLASVTLEMEAAGDIARFLDDIKTEIEAIDDFPDGVDDPVSRIAGRDDFLAAIAISGPMSATDLKLLAEGLKRQMQQIPEFSKIEISGFSDRQIRIEISQEALARHGVTLQDIAAAVASQNTTRPLGEIENDRRLILLRLTEERRDPQTLGDIMIIGSSSGAEIRLADIAHIEPTFEDKHTKFELDGKRAALVRVYKNRRSDTLRSIAAVKTFIAGQRQTLPRTVTITLTQDVSSVVQDRLDMLIRNGWQGILLVVGVLWLFFGMRFAFWVAMGLPVSFLGTLGVMALLGISINMITMVGLLISIGLLMDDALVIAENVATRYRQGLPAGEAAWQGTAEVLPGVGLSFLTTVAVFGALAFIGGDLGQILRFVPIVLLLTLSVSMIEAFFILPRHLSHAFPSRQSGTGVRLREKVSGYLDWASHHIAGRLAEWAVRYRYLAFGLMLFTFLGAVSVLAGGLLKFQAFPDLEGDVIVAQILLPQGTPLSRTESTVRHLTSALETVEAELGPREGEGNTLIRHVSVEFGSNSEAFESGSHVATLTVDLLSAEQRVTRIDELVSRWRQQVGILPDVLWLRFADFQIGAAGRPLEIRLAGLPPDQLKSAARDLTAWLSGYRGLADVADDLRPGKPEARLTLRQGARAAGLTAAQLADQIAAGFQGKTADEIQLGLEGIEIDLRFSPGDRNSLDDLDEMPILMPDGTSVPLGTLAHVRSGRGWARLNRIDGETTVTVIGEIDRSLANVSEVLADTQTRFFPDLRERYPELKIAIKGEQDTASETQADIGRALIIGVLAILLLLSFQLRSYGLAPLIVLLIPMSLIGVVIGHLLLGFNLSLPSMVGFVALAGVAVNGAILMVGFVQNEVANGTAVPAASRQAATRRFRAIFLTSVTTILGMLPLLVETSIQAQILQPLVVSIVFGLVVSVFLGMLIVPCLLAILHDFGWQLQDSRSSEVSDTAP